LQLTLIPKTIKYFLSLTAFPISTLSDDLDYNNNMNGNIRLAMIQIVKDAGIFLLSAG